VLLPPATVPCSPPGPTVPCQALQVVCCWPRQPQGSWHGVTPGLTPSLHATPGRQTQAAAAAALGQQLQWRQVFVEQHVSQCSCSWHVRVQGIKPSTSFDSDGYQSKSARCYDDKRLSQGVPDRETRDHILCPQDLKLLLALSSKHQPFTCRAIIQQ
jgi:hypothetical protein